ncbi:hypothetical protein LguiA_029628 [Lonicera macranthoides]
MMPLIRTSAMRITRQQIKEQLLALQNALPAASLSSLQVSPTLPLLVSAYSTTYNNATTTAVCAYISIYMYACTWLHILWLDIYEFCLMWSSIFSI